MRDRPTPTDRQSPIPSRVARSIRLVGLDVDGVLTDGGIYLGDVAGKQLEFKRYDIQDGLGIYLLRQAGIRVVVVTGRVSESVKLRCAELQIEDFAQDAQARKLPAFMKMLEKHRIDPRECAFIGDDFPDMGIMRTVGLPVAVANAVAEIQAVAYLTLSRSGGAGAVREFTEMLLKARGEWEDLVERYVAERSALEPQSPVGGRES